MVTPGTRPGDAGGADAGTDSAEADVIAPDVGMDVAMEASPCPNTMCVVNGSTLIIPFSQYPALAAWGSVLLRTAAITIQHAARTS